MSNEKTNETLGSAIKRLVFKMPLPVHADILKVQAYRKLKGENPNLSETVLGLVVDALALPKHQKAFSFKKKAA